MKFCACITSNILVICLAFNLVIVTGLAQQASTAQTSTSSAIKKHESFAGTDSGALAVFTPSGKKLGTCPLQHTTVKANVSGYIARVAVTQLFANPFKEKIEAVYTFPLSESAAVNEMTMKACYSRHN